MTRSRHPDHDRLAKLVGRAISVQRNGGVEGAEPPS